MRLDNSILYGNSAPFGPQVVVQLFNDPGYDGGSITVATSDVDGGVAGQNGVQDGGGNIDADPGFVSFPSDLHLSGAQPGCIDTGNNGVLPEPVITDLDGHARVVNNTVDIGAYEWFNSDTVGPTITFGDATPAANFDLQPNGVGWNNSAVSIPFTVTDAGSGVASSTPGPLEFTAEGYNQTQTVTAKDNAGNSSKKTSPPVNIDLT